jgi:RimJ/RimL family protein N-acetyltransferase
VSVSVPHLLAAWLHVHEGSTKIIIMRQRPTLMTQRLILRPFVLGDADKVQRLAGAKEIAAITLAIPHPYEDGMAEQWISSHQTSFESGGLINFAIVIAETDSLCGSIGLGIEHQHTHAGLGYWIGLPFWNKGYCTEAARAVIGYGFETLALHRIHACHLASNPASGRVMQKVGMQYEGCQREHVRKAEQYHDVLQYGVLATEWKDT